MFRKRKTIISSSNSSTELATYIDGYDVYNSLLLKYMSSPDIDKVSYTITRYECRPDLIAKDFYGSDSYTGLVIVQCGLKLEEFTRGTTIYLIPKTVIDSLIKIL